MIRKKITTIVLSAMMVLSVVTPTSALNTLERIKGKNNYETAAKISDMRSYSSIILVNMDNTVADGLSAAALAGAKNGVILLTSANKIPEETQSRLNVANNIYIIGNEKAVSKSIEENLKSKGKNVTRLGGKNRYETSYQVAKEVIGNGSIDKVFLANGVRGEADIVSASPVAYREKAPILLTNGKSIDNDLKEIADSAAKRYIIGGTSVVNSSVQNSLKDSERIGGADRYATNKLIIDRFYSNPKDFYIVDKNDYTIASVACSICTSKPLVLINYNTNPTVLSGAREIIALGNIPENSIARAVGYSGGIDRFNYDWTKYRYIAHAMGGIDGKDYTNSRQAMEYNYKKGFRVFEVDINLSSDDELIAWHSFSKDNLKDMKIPTKYSSKRPTLSEFKTLKPYGKYNTMSFKDIVNYMEDHRDMYIIIDSKSTKDATIRKVYEKIVQEASGDVLSRIIPQAYNDSTYKRILNVHDFDSMLFTCYTMNKVNEDRITNLCAFNGIKVLTIDSKLYTKSLVDKCNAKGIKLYMNTYNNKKTVDKLRKSGVYGFYTDFLNP